MTKRYFIKIEVTQDLNYLNDIVDIHMRTFTGFFLTFLGKGFLKTLYWGFLNHPKSGVIIALENNKPIGFCAYSEDLSDFYNYLIRKKLFHFAWYAAGAFLKKPKSIFRLLNAFKYSNESKRKDAYIELSSIGVLPSSKNAGVGSKLINALVKTANSEKFKYIKLETDRDNNIVANNFYTKNGFVLNQSFETPEGRGMNEYRYYLGAIR
jgi:ribosomal protein S18 acetylase RimI-like enzyme